MTDACYLWRDRHGNVGVTICGCQDWCSGVIAQMVAGFAEDAWPAGRVRKASFVKATRAKASRQSLAVMPDRRHSQRLQPAVTALLRVFGAGRHLTAEQLKIGERYSFPGGFITFCNLISPCPQKQMQAS